MQTQVRQDLLDHLLLEDRGNDLQLAAVVGAVIHVDLEDPLEQLGPAQPHRVVMLTARRGLGRRCGMRVLLGLLRHHQRPQLGVGGQYAVVRAAGVCSLREAKLRGHQTDQVQPGAWHQRRQPLHELQR